MNPLEQRIRIAEACGWTENQYGKWSKDGEVGINGFMPDYLKDLNAMHEAEIDIIFKRGLNKTFGNHLYDILNQRPVKATGLTYDDLVTAEEVASLRIHATAVQRAEAFLKTLNLWVSDEQL